MSQTPRQPDEAPQAEVSAAEARYRRILSSEPENAEALYQLSVLEARAGRVNEAMEFIFRAIRASPRRAEFHHLAGRLFAVAGRSADSLTAFRNCLTLDPNFFAACLDSGNVLLELGRHREAAEFLERALRLQPRSQKAHRALVRALINGAEFDRAAEVARAAVALWPESAQVRNDLGIVMSLKEEVDEAIAAFGGAIEIDPGFFLAHNNLAHALQSKGELGQAVAAYDRALEISPMAVGVASNRIYCLQSKLDLDPKAINQELAAWDERFGRPLRQSIRPHGNNRSPDRQLRIGYVSGDFRQHVVTWNLLPILEQHDREKFKIYCYSSTERTDEFTERVKNRADEWRSLVGVGDEAAAEMIRGDKIDILVDLALHTAGNRLLVFARKPAPLQMTYLGYAGTSGLPTIDYRLSDPYLDPPDADLNVYSEKTMRLPRTYWCYRPGGELPEVAAAPSLGSGQITFGCLANFAKVSAAAQELWGRILGEMPGSRLLLYCSSRPQREIVRERLANSGVDAARVEFTGWHPLEEYARTYHRIDVALDPFPRGGGITTCDALWMGVPVITLAGKSAIARGGCSILSVVGLPQLIAQTPEEYVALAKRAAEWVELRPGMRERMRQSPLMDAAGFARDLETIYRRVWNEWAAQNA